MINEIMVPYSIEYFSSIVNIYQKFIMDKYYI